MKDAPTLLSEKIYQNDMYRIIIEFLFIHI